MRLSSTFAKLRPSTGNALSALPFPTEASAHRVARTADGRPIVLFATPGDVSGSQVPTVRMAHIETYFGRHVQLTGTTGREDTGLYAGVELLSSDPEIFPFFLDALQPVADQLPGATTSQALAPLLERVYQLFLALGSEPRNTPLGAWGELFVMAESGNTAQLVEMWHAHPDDLVDFSRTDRWIEVKATTGSERRHQVSQRQVSPPPGCEGILVSIQTASTGGGLTIRELAGRIRSRLPVTGGALSKFDAVLAAQLGSQFAAAMPMAFDERLARQAMRLFSMQDLPQIPGAIPAAIRDLRYVLDLVSQPPMSAPAETVLR